MKALLIIILFFIPVVTPDFSGKVIAVLDGDTIEVLNSQNKAIRIRLSAIDCPEKSQAFGTRAKQYTASLCFSKTVLIKVTGEDQYGRTLANVILPDGKILNQELIKDGFAWHYKRYSTDQLLSDLEVQARKNKLGLWSDPAPIAPWEFRKLRK